MNRVSTKLESGVGFSNGCAELALKNPPPFVPNCLIDDLGCRRALRDGLRLAFQSGRRRVYYRSSESRLASRGTVRRSAQSGNRIYTVPRTMSTQKFPMVFCWRRANPRTSAMATAMPAAADTKFCTVKADHLDEIAERRLAAICLPVGVGHETDRGVEREIGSRLLPTETRPDSAAASPADAGGQYTSEKQTTLNASSEAAYCVQRCSTSSFTPPSA